MQLKIKIITVLIITLIFSCNKQIDEFTIIEGKSVGNFVLGRKLNKPYNKSDIIIETNSNKIINSITIISDKYHTSKGISINMSKDKVISIYGKPISDGLYLNKGNIKIGKALDGLIYKNIYFITNNDIVTKILLMNN